MVWVTVSGRSAHRRAQHGEVVSKGVAAGRFSDGCWFGLAILRHDGPATVVARLANGRYTATPGAAHTVWMTVANTVVLPSTAEYTHRLTQESILMIAPDILRHAILSTAVVLGISAGAARAETDAEVAAVTAASDAFYTALSTFDQTGMEKVWAHESYVSSIGPANRATTTGWATLADGYRSYMTRMAPDTVRATIKAVDTRVHINGSVAWIVGLESYDRAMKDGTSATGTNLMSNIFEMKEGRWLMVSHHASRTPQ
jgi:hypothetical protein